MKQRFLVIGALFGFGCVSALAQYDYQFTAANGTAGVGDWADPDNWNPSGTPGATHRVLIQSGKTANVEAQDQSVKEMVIEGEVHIIDRTLTIGNGSATTTSGGILIFKDVSGARESILKVEDNTELSGMTIATQVGEVGIITYADTKEDVLKLSSNTTISGSIHLFVNVTSTGSHFFVTNTSDEMLIGSDADPDPSDSGFNAYDMSGDVDFTVKKGTCRFQRMYVNDVSGYIYTGVNTSSSDTSLTEFRHYADTKPTANATSISFAIFENGTLDLKTNVGARGLSINPGGTGNTGDAVVKLASGKIAIFDPN